MKNATFESFKAASLAAGFDEVLEKQWEPNLVKQLHTHPFDVEAVVAQGEMWLTCGDETRHLQAGDDFTLTANVSHAERYGALGAVNWIARRHVRPA
jgi:hypothetical protein